MEFSKHPRQYLNSFLGCRAFEQGDAVARHAPLEVHLQLSSTCNLDCLMCTEHLHAPAARRTRELQFLSPGIFGKLENEILSSVTRLMLGVGGEPLLSPQFFDYAERAQRLGVEVEVLTNGTMITSEEAAEQLARFFSFINISIDGATGETYEGIRRGASFAGLLEGIERLNRHRLARPAAERPRLHFCTVLMQCNIHELPELVRLAHRLSVDRVCAAHVVPMTPEGRAESLFVDRERSDRFLLEASIVAAELGLELDLPRPFSDEAAARLEPLAPEDSRARAVQRKHELDQGQTNGVCCTPPTAGRLHCHMPTLSVYVLVDGRVYPCAHPLVQQGEPLGDLSTRSFAEIWNGRPFRNLRAGLAAGDAPAGCRSCFLMQNPPPTPEDSAGVTGNGADLVSHYAERDLVPCGGEVPAMWVLDAPAQALLGESLRRLNEEPGLLRDEIRQLTAHAATIELECQALQAHCRVTDQERSSLRAHAANLEEEREHLLKHVANLDRVLSKIHGRRLYGALCRMKDLFVRPDRKG